VYKARILLKPASHITGEEARDARVRALRYALDRYFEKQKAATTSGGEKGSGEPQAPREPDKDRRP
jgi:hypothetical protein